MKRAKRYFIFIFYFFIFSGKCVRAELFVPEVTETDDEGKEVFFFWRKVCASGTVRA
jgi:hypothetical protein